ncbi:alpha-glucosidase [Vibrio parahaemolyticus]|uniref:alpha-glucosidase n=1 Tax=Vibrio sp. dhg TaxID=2163016 RepID=UPI000E540E17|nr:alpha-glucosidase [Vibrio sp. dhg]AXT73717.1 alpha-glucosidase [Vibrio sp. dhg]TBT04043.1 alpha-glucosidase [Vibrio parahaemolyticus]
MKLIQTQTGFIINHKNRTVLEHTEFNPALYLGIGQGTFDMYRGNFDIKDYVVERLPLKKFVIAENTNDIMISFSYDGDVALNVRIFETVEGRLKLEFTSLDAKYNRFWIRLAATENEAVYGCGEQLSYLNLRGKNFPLWSSEPGVGRNKNSYTTWQADVKDKAGGDYYNTNYPQPTFISDKKYFCHLETTAYADFDFTHKQYHELQCWNIPDYLLLDAEDSFPELMTNITDVFGRQPRLPEWVYNGVILGIQGGTEITLDKISSAKEAGIELAGVWCQDWQGIKMTSFGKRLQWDWQWNEELYPDLNTKIHQMKEDGIRFLGYINPYVLESFPLYEEALDKGYLATKEDGSKYVVDFGEFYCGVVDFTNPEACEWYKGVIQKNMIDFGLDGWMGDFGEYLPTDCSLYNGVSAEIEHNKWPLRWAKVQHEAVREAGKTDDILFFMRAGATGIQRYCHALWAGDQSVFWEKDDGLASVIPAALSAGLMGNGISHSDIGGYTTLHGNKRSKELFQRWAEMAAFTPIMRTHEGNRPDDNHQFDTDSETMAHLARMTKVYKHLKPYIKAAVEENATKGMPVQRPLFMHYEQDSEAYQIQYQYLFGRDLLVAPVYNQGETVKKLYLPEDEWVHVWSGETFTGGWVKVDAPVGQPPVFYRKKSKSVHLLESIQYI